jgi:hypothetical protein
MIVIATSGLTVASVSHGLGSHIWAVGYSNMKLILNVFLSLTHATTFVCHFHLT